MKASGLITDIRARAVILTPKAPTMTSAGVMSNTPLVLIDVQTNAGWTGTSYLRCYTTNALRPLRDLVLSLGSTIIGERVDTDHVLATLRREVFHVGAQGLTGMAIAGIDMALWDIVGKDAGQPLFELLGARQRPIDAYASLRSMLPMDAAREAAAAVDADFRAVKLKVGGGSLSDDMAAIREVRRAVGTSVALMIDYNQALSRAEARVRLPALDDHALYWIEEPLRADDYSGYAALRSFLHTPIQVGENFWGAADVEKAIDACAPDHLMFDAMKIGGVSGWREALNVLGDRQIPLSSHAFPEISAHLLTASQTACWVEYIDHVGSILRNPVLAEKGSIVASGRAGLDLEWDETAVGRAEV